MMMKSMCLGILKTRSNEDIFLMDISVHNMMLVDPDNTVQQELDLVVFRDGCGKAKMMYRSFDSHS